MTWLGEENRPSGRPWLRSRWAEHEFRIPSSLEDLRGQATGLVELHVAWSGRRDAALVAGAGHFVGTRCDTAVMDTLSDIPDTSYKLPLGEADQAALRAAVLRDLGALPFEPGALISRSLWVIFIGEWGVWTHAVLPVDDSLDIPDRKSIAGLCDLAASLIRPPLCHDDEKAMIVLRRPGPAEISEADAYIFGLVRQAAACRETAAWTFHVAGPDGTWEVTEHEDPPP